MLLDSGETTLQQMVQMYGLEKTKDILANLQAVFISHLHYDHHGVSTSLFFCFSSSPCEMIRVSEE